MELDLQGPIHRPSAFLRMEALMNALNDKAGGITLKTHKLILTTVPGVFVGYELIEWIMFRFGIEESEALNIANQLCQYGYVIPNDSSKPLAVKDDSSLYRIQSPFYWPYRNRPPDNVDYAVYLYKRTLRNKQKHALEDYELEALNNLKRNLANRWDYIMSTAEEQYRELKRENPKKADKLINDLQERAYWRVHRPPPGVVNVLEACPVPTRSWNGGRQRRRTLEDCKREVALLRSNLSKTRMRASQAIESLIQYVDIYAEYDPLAYPAHTVPSNPWCTEDLAYWQLNSPLVDAPTEKRVKRWGLSMEELVSDPTGLQEFTNYLRKEYSHENIRFWMAVNDLRRSAQSQIVWKVQEIFEEFLAPGAPCEINIDGKTMEKVHQEMRSPSRFTFDAAQEHVYTLLLKKDCYPRFIRSEYYKNLLATGVQPSQKKRFFGFGQAKKKTMTTTTSSASNANQQGGATAQQQTSQAVAAGALNKRRGSDRSLSGSAHELAVSGVKDSKVPHSHSQSNLSDIPYRVKKPSIAIVAGTSTSEDVCPWESGPEPRSRKNSAQHDSGSSSSDVSVAIVEATEKVQRSCLLTQHTLDSGGRKLSAHHADEAPRRASVSVPITHISGGGGEGGSRRKISSFEDTPSAVTGASSSSAVFAVPPHAHEDDNRTNSVCRTFKKSHSLAKNVSVVISVSSSDDRQAEGEGETAAAVATEEEEEEEQELEPMAPLAEPDSESPASEFPPSEQAENLDPEAEGEAKSNDVCPWENEETCKVDTPFVKTYATLGYL